MSIPSTSKAHFKRILSFCPDLLFPSPKCFCRWDSLKRFEGKQLIKEESLCERKQSLFQFEEFLPQVKEKGMRWYISEKSKSKKEGTCFFGRQSFPNVVERAHAFKSLSPVFESQVITYCSSDGGQITQHFCRGLLGLMREKDSYVTSEITGTKYASRCLSHCVFKCDFLSS